MINVNEIAEAIKKELGSFNSTDAHKSNDLIRYINSAARLIVIEKNFPFNKYSYSLTTDENNTEYSIPYQIETFFVLNSSGDELDLKTFEDYYRTKDKDNLVMINEDTLVTTYVGDLDIYYRGFVDTITTLTGTINMPSHFFDLIVLGGTYYGFLDIKAYNKAAEKKGIFDGLIKSLATRQSDKLPLNTKRFNKGTSNVF